jgi:hypothetical protein
VASDRTAELRRVAERHLAGGGDMVTEWIMPVVVRGQEPDLVVLSGSVRADPDGLLLSACPLRVYLLDRAHKLTAELADAGWHCYGHGPGIEFKSLLRGALFLLDGRMVRADEEAFVECQVRLRLRWTEWAEEGDRV